MRVLPLFGDHLLKQCNEVIYRHSSVFVILKNYSFHFIPKFTLKQRIITCIALISVIIHSKNGGVSAIQEEVSLSYVVCINKPFPHWIIIPAPQVVQSSFLIIHIPTIAERIHRAQRSSHRASLADRITPRIINIFYHPRTIRVNQRSYIALKIIHIEIAASVKSNHCRLVLCISPFCRFSSCQNFHTLLLRGNNASF